MSSATGSSSDTEKLALAISEIVERFSSVDNLLEGLGLSGLPTAQRYGILFGCCVFGGTMIAVATLLTLGGTFTRIVEQAQTGEASVKNPHKVRSDRPLLLERLLESRRFLMERYNEKEKTQQEQENNRTTTPLQKLLLNIAPTTQQEGIVVKKTTTIVPPGYEENYKIAYRKCQDQPGGDMLPGRPEARYEAYARAYAGSSSTDIVLKNYRRSYAKLYESMSCIDHRTDDYYTKLWESTPGAIVGKHVRLEPLDAENHLQQLWETTNGQSRHSHTSYDPNEIWSFLPYGPFASPEDMAESELFTFRNKNYPYSTKIVASFAIRQNITDVFVGIIQLSNDDPANLSIQLELPIVPPYINEKEDNGSNTTKIALEACFLLLDKLFSLGYRRIQLSVDCQDVANKKLATRLCFTLEGLCYRACIVKESSSDRNVYALLNNEFFMDKGVRYIFCKRLYGEKAASADATMRKTEDENDIKLEHLRNEKEKEAAAAVADAKSKKQQ